MHSTWKLLLSYIKIKLIHGNRSASLAMVCQFAWLSHLQFSGNIKTTFTLFIDINEISSFLWIGSQWEERKYQPSNFGGKTNNRLQWIPDYYYISLHIHHLCEELLWNYICAKPVTNKSNKNLVWVRCDKNAKRTI